MIPEFDQWLTVMAALAVIGGMFLNMILVVTLLLLVDKLGKVRKHR